VQKGSHVPPGKGLPWTGTVQGRRDPPHAAAASHRARGRLPGGGHACRRRVDCARLRHHPRTDRRRLHERLAGGVRSCSRRSRHRRHSQRSRHPLRVRNVARPAAEHPARPAADGTAPRRLPGRAAAGLHQLHRQAAGHLHPPGCLQRRLRRRARGREHRRRLHTRWRPDDRDDRPRRHPGRIGHGRCLQARRCLRRDERRRRGRVERHDLGIHAAGVCCHRTAARSHQDLVGRRRRLGARTRLRVGQYHPRPAFLSGRAVRAAGQRRRPVR
jgi:hypothetical protein